MRTQIIDNLRSTYLSCDTPPPLYRGKVRDVYADKGDLIIVASDRVSVFDQVVGTIPLKGALLTEQSTFWLRKASAVLKTHLIAQEDAQIQRCMPAAPFKFEIIVRAYLAGSLAREPADVRGYAYGLSIAPKVRAYEQFDTPLITPTTKASNGEHDEAISLEQIIQAGLASRHQIDFIVEKALDLFSLGTDFALTRGLILADTKYEFGLHKDEVILIDEIHTADSSRYWKADTLATRIAAGLEPEMFDKERLRRVLISQGVDPKGSSAIPPLTDDLRIDLATHYWTLTETLTGQPFSAPSETSKERVSKWLKRITS